MCVSVCVCVYVWTCVCVYPTSSISLEEYLLIQIFILEVFWEEENLKNEFSELILRFLEWVLEKELMNISSGKGGTDNPLYVVIQIDKISPLDILYQTPIKGRALHNYVFDAV